MYQWGRGYGFGGVAVCTGGGTVCAGGGAVCIFRGRPAVLMLTRTLGICGLTSDAFIVKGPIKKLHVGGKKSLFESVNKRHPGKPGPVQPSINQTDNCFISMSSNSGATEQRPH